MAELDPPLVNRRVEGLFSFKARSPVGRFGYRAAIELPYVNTAVRPNTTIAHADKPANTFRVLLYGFAATFQRLGDHPRQIVALHFPGDCIAIGDLFTDKSRFVTTALTASSFLEFSADAVRDLTKRDQDLAEILMRELQGELAISQQWLLTVGRRDSKARLAAFLCEFLCRFKSELVEDGHSFVLPFTQDQLGDMLALTAIHVNRMLRMLEEDGLIARTKRNVQILDWKGLKKLAAFDDAYLR